MLGLVAVWHHVSLHYGALIELSAAVLIFDLVLLAFLRFLDRASARCAFHGCFLALSIVDVGGNLGFIKLFFAFSFLA